MAPRLQYEQRERQANLNLLSGGPYTRTDPNEYAEEFGRHIDNVARIVSESYAQAFEKFGVTKPSKALETAIRERLSNTMDTIGESHMNRVRKFAQDNADEWPWAQVEAAVHSARTYVQGQTELLLHSARPKKAGSPTRKNTIPQRAPHPYKVTILSVLLTALVTVGLTLYVKRVVDPGTEQIKEAVAARQQLTQELFSRLEAVRLPDRGSFIEATLSEDPKLSANMLKRARATLDTLNLGADLMTIKLGAAFDSQAQNDYGALRFHINEALNGLEKWRNQTHGKLQVFLQSNGSREMTANSSELDSFYKVNSEITAFENRLFLFK